MSPVDFQRRIWANLALKREFLLLRASSHEPGPLTGTNFTLGSYEKFQKRLRDENAEDELWREIRETKQTWRNTKL